MLGKTGNQGRSCAFDIQPWGNSTFAFSFVSHVDKGHKTLAMSCFGARQTLGLFAHIAEYPG